jgi:hypothetical protein
MQCQERRETRTELLDRLGMGYLKKDIEAAACFCDVAADQVEGFVWRR